MTIRRCIYTNREAKAKDQVLSKSVFPELLHNWCNSAPVSEEYKTKKQGSISELEMMANEYFHLLELHEMRVEYYKQRLSEIQSILSKELTDIEEAKAKELNEEEERKKEQEIKAMVKLKEASDSLNDNLAELLNNRLESFKDVIGDITLTKDLNPSDEEDDEDIWSK